MIDREKVIKGIRKCLSHKPCSENGCPYENECAVEHLNDPLLRDALALLKEQEPVKPYFVNTNYEQHWKCGNCDWVIGTQYNFCTKCGKPVKRNA